MKRREFGGRRREQADKAREEAYVHLCESAPYEAEAAVLGSVLRDNATIRVCRAVLREDDFRDFANRLVWRAVLAISDRSAEGERHGAQRMPVDAVTVADELHRTTSRAGLTAMAEVGYEKLAALLDAAPSPASVAYYARIVLEIAMARRLWHIGDRLAKAAARRHPPSELVEQAVKTLNDVAERLAASDVKLNRSTTVQKSQASARRGRSQEVGAKPAGPVPGVPQAVQGNGKGDGGAGCPPHSKAGAQ